MTIRRLMLIGRFYASAMLVPCVAASAALAWLVVKWGPNLAPWCFVAKLIFDALILYLWIVPRYSGQFYYYLNLGIRPGWLLGASCAADLLLYLILAGPVAGSIHELG